VAGDVGDENAEMVAIRREEIAFAGQKAHASIPKWFWSV
jgi:hypothetical protein